MSREITRAQAEALFATRPPDFTPEDWAITTCEALSVGKFNLAGEVYQIDKGETDECPVDGNECRYALTITTGTRCKTICRRYARFLLQEKTVDII